MFVVGWVFLITAVVALVMAATARADAYRAADKQSKNFWLIILGITAVVNLLVPMLFLQIAGLVASIVFLVDVRPALRQVSGGGRRSGGSSSDGPYGPYNGGR
ncbi:membrane protein [Streptomyces spiroverticillatus]|uniref:Membrane protein n=2 Tax=Streptomyces TaxID=1883 RepID=A0A919C807_9ACTN|nr:membrane protein [Streptomyces spiroverticillatus]GHC82134.1 membrane protein [Streptomyces finlayi]